MIRVGVVAILSVGVSAAWWRAGRGLFSAEVFTRVNYGGRGLPTSVGVLLPLTVATLGAADAVVGSVRDRGGWMFPGPTSGGIAPLLALAFAFSFLGVIDDVAGVGESGGFRGHLSALARGRLTTGAFKMLGGPLVAIGVVGATSWGSGLGPLLRDAALVSLAANLANLFDRSPGRIVKVGGLAALGLAGATRSVALAPVATVVGGSFGLLVPDLREKMMLGDAGSNVIGAALGWGVVVSVGPSERWIVLAALLGANLMSEVVSFTRVIDAVAPLRWLDRLGAPHRS